MSRIHCGYGFQYARRDAGQLLQQRPASGTCWPTLNLQPPEQRPYPEDPRAIGHCSPTRGGTARTPSAHAVNMRWPPARERPGKALLSCAEPAGR